MDGTFTASYAAGRPGRRPQVGVATKGCRSGGGSGEAVRGVHFMGSLGAPKQKSSPSAAQVRTSAPDRAADGRGHRQRVARAAGVTCARVEFRLNTVSPRASSVRRARGDVSAAAVICPWLKGLRGGWEGVDPGVTAHRFSCGFDSLR